VSSDFDDIETDGSRGQEGGERIHATISVDGVVTTKLLPASGKVTIGRASTCDLVISHISVSRHHATLRMSPLQIVDEGSRNGTRIRGRTLASGTPTAIAPGDAIQLGDAAVLLQPVMMSFDGKPLVEPLGTSEGTVQVIESECERSARTGSPFAVVQIATEDGKPKDILALLRGFLRTTDIVKNDGDRCVITVGLGQ
jgi:pSer/pThr/pTyr-binding forkhead associated (FHA) protein